MNLSLIMEIAQLALSLVSSVVQGTQAPASLTATLLQILQKGAHVYQQQTGLPLDPSLLHTETTV